jgi:hypothetical protein
MHSKRALAKRVKNVIALEPLRFNLDKYRLASLTDLVKIDAAICRRFRIRLSNST